MIRLFLLILIIFSYAEIQASKPSYIYLQGNPWGESSDSNKVYIGEIGAGWQLRKKDPKDSVFFALTELNIIRFFGKNQLYSKQKKQFNVYGAAFIFRWIVPEKAKYLEQIPLRPWVQIGSGPNYFSTRNVCFKSNPLSTKLQFATHLGVGVRLGVKQHGELAFFYKHFSNANIKYPNYCLDTIEARLGYWF